MIKTDIKTVKITDIKLNPDNPRTITGKKMTDLAKSLTSFPEMLNIREIVVDETMSGVYAIFNSIDDRIYIGSAVSMARRITQHKADLKAGRHKNIHLQRFFNKHGKESIRFALLCGVPKESLIKAEQFYIDMLKPQFNINQKADSCLGIKRSAETRKRLSEKRLSMNIRYNDDYKRRMSVALSGKNNPMYGKSPNRGRKHKPETIQKMIKSHQDVSGANNPKYGIPQSPEATAKALITKHRRTLARGRGVKVVQNGKVISVFHSAIEAAKELSINFSNIYRAIEKRQGRCKGFVFSFTGGQDAISQIIRA